LTRRQISRYSKNDYYFMIKRKKSTGTKKQEKTSAKKLKWLKGGVDAGTVYGVLLLAIVLGGAYMMLGNISPNIASPDEGQPVIQEQSQDTSTHKDLQLKDFPGVTLTPTPTDTPTPTPPPTQPPPAPAGNGGGNGGGNSAPAGNGGGGGGAPAAPGAM
jgi:hypothetical protein